MHADSVRKAERVVIIDDLIATGSSSISSIDLVKKLGAKPVGFAALVDLAFLRESQKSRKPTPKSTFLPSSNSTMRNPLGSLTLGLLVMLHLKLRAGGGRVELSPSGPAAAKWASKTLAKMTLEEKVGQMIAWRYNGYFFNRDSNTVKELVELVGKEKIGA